MRFYNLEWIQINRDASTRVFVPPSSPQATTGSNTSATPSTHYLRFIAETVRERVFAGTDGGGVRARSSLPPRS